MSDTVKKRCCPWPWLGTRLEVTGYFGQGGTGDQGGAGTSMLEISSSLSFLLHLFPHSKAPWAGSSN